MGLNNVKEEVIEEAKRKAKEITDRAKEEAKKIQEKANAVVGEYKQKEEEKLKAETEALERRENASLILEEKKMLIDKKKKIINETFDAAKKKIMSMGRKEKSMLYNGLIKKAEKQMGVRFVYCNKNDKALVKSKKFAVVEDSISGGLIFENQEKTVRIDYSFETILETLREKELQTIAKLIFGE